MIEHYFVQSKVLRRMRAGLMRPYLGSLAAELQARHHSRKGILQQLAPVVAEVAILQTSFKSFVPTFVTLSFCVSFLRPSRGAIPFFT